MGRSAAEQPLAGSDQTQTCELRTGALTAGAQ
jgi:hypothetical protein